MNVLPNTYRFTVYNETGQQLAIGAVVVTGVRWKVDSSGVLTWESSEATLLDNASAINDQTYANGTTQDNDLASTRWLGGSFVFEATAPASSNGPVILYLQESTDGGTTWSDDGENFQVGRLDFTSSGTKRTPLRVLS